jgi:hypothetical protein
MPAKLRLLVFVLSVEVAGGLIRAHGPIIRVASIIPGVNLDPTVIFVKDTD